MQLERAGLNPDDLNSNVTINNSNSEEEECFLGERNDQMGGFEIKNESFGDRDLDEDEEIDCDDFYEQTGAGDQVAIDVNE